MARFNYIITIHNKEKLLNDVLARVFMCAREESAVYAVLDGCTDRSEAIVDAWREQVTDLPLHKVVTSDVHELRTINAGLAAASQDGDGFNVILQDDVLLGDCALERKVTELYKWAGGDLGYVSLRLGADITREVLSSGSSIPYRHYAENAYGHGITGATPLAPGEFAERTVPIKSPVCLPFSVVRELGPYDESLAPYGHDDLEMALRVKRKGLRNGVFALRFASDIEWGGTRETPHPELDKVITRNMVALRERFGDELLACAEAVDEPAPVQQVPGLYTAAEAVNAQSAWREAQRVLSEYERGSGARVLKAVVGKARRKLAGSKAL